VVSSPISSSGLVVRKLSYLVKFYWRSGYGVMVRNRISCRDVLLE
jgi:hypothetical protein